MNQGVRRRKRPCYIYIWRHYIGIHTKRTTIKFRKKSRLLDHDSNLGPSKYEAEELNVWSTEYYYSVCTVPVLLTTFALIWCSEILMSPPTGSYAVQAQWWRHPHHLPHYSETLCNSQQSEFTYFVLFSTTKSDYFVLNNINTLFVTKARGVFSVRYEGSVLKMAVP